MTPVLLTPAMNDTEKIPESATYGANLTFKLCNKLTLGIRIYQHFSMFSFLQF